MNDVEMDLALKEYGERWRAAQPAPPAVPDVLRPRRWPVAAGVAAAVLAIVTAAGVVVVRRDSGTPQVPAAPTQKAPSWAPQPVSLTVPWQPDPVPPQPLPESPTETAPACADAELDMLARFSAPTEKQRNAVAGILEIRNTGDRTCQVKSTFSWFPAGVPSSGDDPFKDFKPHVVARLAPGELAVASLSWGGQECSGTSELDRIRVIPHSDSGLGERIVPAAGLVRGRCDQPAGDRGSGGHAYTATKHPEREVARLAATLEAPASIRKGDVLKFSVTLANPTDRPVSFGRPGTPCPVVSFGFGVVAHLESHLLRCDEVPGRAIAPGDAVTFEFEVRESAESEEPGSPHLGWGFDVLHSDGIGWPIAITD